jgi:ribosomal protein L25 (general stress protein Ctc)
MSAAIAHQTALEISAEPRDSAKNPRQLRALGLIPATLYGGKETPVSIQVSEDAIALPISRGQRMFSLTLSGKSILAKAHQIQTVSTTDQVLAIEFLRTAG